jgi:hypothetical protein
MYIIPKRKGKTTKILGKSLPKHPAKRGGKLEFSIFTMR